MSYPPEVKLGREDFGWGMRVFRRTVKRVPPREEYNLDRIEFEKVMVYLAKRAGYSWEEIATVIKRPRRTLQRWHKKVDDLVAWSGL